MKLNPESIKIKLVGANNNFYPCMMITSVPMNPKPHLTITYTFASRELEKAIKEEKKTSRAVNKELSRLKNFRGVIDDDVLLMNNQEIATRIEALLAS